MSPTARAQKRAGGARAASVVLIWLILAATFLAMPTGSADAAPRISSNGAGDLTITGDNGNDNVTLFLGPDRTKIRIIHSGGTVEQTLDGPRRNITINLRGGTDQVLLTVDRIGQGKATVGRNLTINMGSGDESVTVDDHLVFSGQVRVVNQSGKFSLNLIDAIVGGSVTVSTGTGRSQVRAVGTLIDGSLTVRSASTGTVGVITRGVSIGGNYNVTGGNGRDHTELDLGTVVLGRTSVNLRGGIDRFEARGSRLGRGGTVQMGAGTDTALLFDVDIDGRFLFRGQADDDELLPTLVDFNGPAILDGGPGHDRVDGEANTFAVPARLIGFEVS